VAPVQPPAPAAAISGDTAASAAPTEAAKTASEGTSSERTRRRGPVEVELPLLRVDEGALPGWAYGLGLGAGVRLSHLQFHAAGLLWLPQDSTSGAYRVHYVRYTGELSGCYRVPLHPIEIGPCLFVRFEDVTAGGTGPQVVPKPGPTPRVTVGVAAQARWSIGSWAAVVARPSVAFATSRPSFSIAGVGPLYQVPLAGFALDLGCEWLL
jgi:hypothetical protein